MPALDRSGIRLPLWGTVRVVAPGDGGEKEPDLEGRPGGVHRRIAAAVLAAKVSRSKTQKGPLETVAGDSHSPCRLRRSGVRFPLSEGGSLQFRFMIDHF